MKNIVKTTVAAALACLLLASCSGGQDAGGSSSASSAQPSSSAPSSSSSSSSAPGSSASSNASSGSGEYLACTKEELQKAIVSALEEKGVEFPEPTENAAKDNPDQTLFTSRSDAGLGYQIVADTKTGQVENVVFLYRTNLDDLSKLDLFGHMVTAASKVCNAGSDQKEVTAALQSLNLTDIGEPVSRRASLDGTHYLYQILKVEPNVTLTVAVSPTA